MSISKHTIKRLEEQIRGIDRKKRERQTMFYDKAFYEASDLKYSGEYLKFGYYEDGKEIILPDKNNL